MHTLLMRLVCLVAVLAGTSFQALAQNPFIVAQQVAPAPKRALPLPDKPVAEGENARALRLNNWTIGLAGGLLEGTFAWYAADLAKALDDGDNLRVMPINTFGAVGNVLDLVYVKGVDFAITYADVLDHYKNVDRIPGIEQRVNYVIPMFQGEFHLFVRPEIKSIQDLAGKKVGFNTVGSAANYTGNIVFERLGVKVEKVFMNNSLALEAMRKGELAGLVHAVGKPNSLFKPLKAEEGFRFLPVEYTDVFKDYYTPAELDARRLSQPDPAGAVGADHLGAGPARRLQLAARHRSLPALRAFRGISLRTLRQAAPAALSAGMEADQPGRHDSRLDALPAGAGDARQDRGTTQDRSVLGEVAGGTRGSQRPGRAGAAVSTVPGVEQASSRVASVMFAPNARS